ncbi:MAG: pilus assembly protein [Sphingomonadales bacterium]|nr:pilus assembly protein [Sphingomonadales bacterium]
MTILSTLRGLLRSRSGMAMTEFALGAPFLLAAGLGGTELANYALVNMKVGQLAVHIADNGSRIGDISSLQNRRIFESDINDLIYGAQIQAGPAMGLYDHGRVIVSSVEVNVPSAGGPAEQYIHWQRCRGAKHIASSYGDEGDVLPNGIGPAGSEIMAQEGDAVIFVELHYTYQPLISAQFLGSAEITSIASFNVRDDRDLSQIYQRDPGNPDPVQTCNQFKGNVTLNTGGEEA